MEQRVAQSAKLDSVQILDNLGALRVHAEHTWTQTLDLVYLVLLDTMLQHQLRLNVCSAARAAMPIRLALRPARLVILESTVQTKVLQPVLLVRPGTSLIRERVCAWHVDQENSLRPHTLVLSANLDLTLHKQQTLNA